jgi:hypothetical protein
MDSQKDATENLGSSRGSAASAREVYAGHGDDRAMGYRFRCRIESRVVRTWFGFGPEVTQYRYVLERYFMAWNDREWGAWSSEPVAHKQANDKLDEISWSPTKEPRSKCFYV